MNKYLRFWIIVIGLALGLGQSVHFLYTLYFFSNNDMVTFSTYGMMAWEVAFGLVSLIFAVLGIISLCQSQDKSEDSD